MGEHSKPIEECPPRKIRAVLLAMIVMALVVGAIVIGSSVIFTPAEHESTSDDDPHTGTSLSIEAESPMIAPPVVTESVAPQIVRETARVSSTVTATATRTNARAATTATVSASASAAPTVTQTINRCLVWDASQAKWEELVCPSTTPTTVGSNNEAAGN